MIRADAKRGRRRAILAAVAAGVLLGLGSEGVATPPPTRYWEGEHLARVRAQRDDPPKAIAESLRGLRHAADAALTRGPYSVVDKAAVPPSGDKRDYLSVSRYWWPNPDTEDGLPFVRRDGVVNRQSVRKGDRVRLGVFSDDFEALSLAAYLVDRGAYAPHARRLLRVWFLEEATRMSPHLKYAQGVPGRAEGRSPGIIDTRCFIWLLDGVVLLEHVDALAAEESAGLRAWFRDYLDWLVTSDLGRGERLAKNNHGAWFAAQGLRVALFVGDLELASELAEATRARIGDAIRADGSQPEELRRTRSLHYSLFSLSAMAAAGRLSESVGARLWGHRGAGGGSLEAALDYAAPHLVDPTGWPHPSIAPYRLSDQGSPLFFLAATRLGRPDLLRAAERAPRRPELEDRRLTPLVFARVRAD